MTSMHSVIPEEKLTEAYRILLEMRDNCVKHADDQYDDPKREAKYEALNIAITAMGRSIPPRWISVEERLPEDDVNVLIYAVSNGDDVDSCIAMTSYTHRMHGFNIEGWRSPWQYFFFDYMITHWMPLPEPPKEE